MALKKYLLKRLITRLSHFHSLFLNFKDELSIAELYARGLVNLGLIFYNDSSLLEAEESFYLATKLNNLTAAVNYAYMLRRGEVDCNRGLTVEQLLKKPICEKDLFAITNLTLYYALVCNDWKRADKTMIQLTHFDDITTICSWWRALEQSGDPEGVLVGSWLLRLNLPSYLHVQEKTILKKYYPSIPNWFFSM